MSLDTSHAAARQHPGGEIRRTVLPGGLRVLTETVPGAVSTNLGFFVAVGSRHEPTRLHGASHFLEHVLFKGTPTRSAEQVSAALEARGGELNAYTAREHTCFHARVLASDTALAVDLLCDMLSNSLVRPADLGVEREVILDEIAMHADDPSELVGDLAIGKLFAGSGLAKLVIGSNGSIRRHSARSVRAWWRENYSWDRIVVSASGAVDHDWLVATVAEGLAGLARRGAERPVDVVQLAPGQLAVRGTGLSQTSACLAWPGCGASDPRRPLVALVAAALGGGMSSRLFVEVRERRALAYTIDASESCWSDTGLFSIEWQSLPDRTGQILGLVAEIVAAVRREGFTADELDAARGQLVGQTLLHYENPAARMFRMGSAEVQGDGWSLEALLDGFETASLAEVNRVAAELLAPPPVVCLAGAESGRAAARTLLASW